MSAPDNLSTGIVVIGSGAASAAVDRVSISLAVEVVSHPRGHNIDPRTVPVMARLLVAASGGTLPGPPGLSRRPREEPS